MTSYQRTSKQRVVLGTELAKGGEGAIYTVVSDNSLVAKKYHDSKLKPGHELEAKLQAMLANPPKDQAIIWPVDLLYDGRKFVGYLMPRLQQTIDLFELYNPQQRQAKYPGTDWKYLHTVARNLASAFLALHQAGYVMGDVNQKNVLVEPNGTIRLVDTDSFQVRGGNGRIFRCSVGVPEYTPREMRHHKDLSKVDRNASQDAFGLGVLVFQLLMEGFHPFTGAPKKPVFSVQQPVMEYCIEQGIFPYDSKSRNQYVPPPNAPSFNNLHSEVKKLFIKCFVDGHSNPASRPSAMDWHKALTIAINDLKQCTKDKTHWYFPSNGNCPWCAKHTARTQSMPPQPTYVPPISPPIPQPYQPQQTTTAPPQTGRKSRSPSVVWIAILIVLLGSIYTLVNTVSFDAGNENRTSSGIIPESASQSQNQPSNPSSRSAASNSSGVLNGSVTASYLHVRSGPGPEYREESSRLRRGDNISMIGRNADGSWLQISGSGQRWVSASHITVNGNRNTLPITFTETGGWGSRGVPTGATVRTTDILRIRGCPSTTCRQLENPDTLERGSVVDVIARSSDGTWLKVNVRRGNGTYGSGWISANYVQFVTNASSSIPVSN